VEDAGDVLVELAALLQLTEPVASARGDTGSETATFAEEPAYSELLEAMNFSPSSIAQLRERTGLTAAELSSMLLLLELEGSVEALPGGLYSRVPKRSA